MKILLVSNAFVDYSIQLANSLRMSGESVYLFLIESPSDSFDQSVSLDTNLLYFKYRTPRLYSPTNFLFQFRLLKKIIIYNPDIIHSQGVSFRFSFLFPIFKILKFPLVITFHDPIPHIGENYLRTRFANYMGRIFADITFVHGEKLRQDMIRKYHYPGDKIRVTQSGEHQVAPFVKYMNDSFHEEPHSILFFGRIYEYKGLQILIEAEPLITKEIPDARIIIAGTGENFKRYEDMMVNKDHFKVYNYPIPYKQGAELFQKCSLVVLPYIDASQSGVIHTAYGFKKPVIATDVGSIPEIVDNTITGIIVPPNNPKALSEAIVNLLNNDTLRHQMGINGYYKLKHDLSWKSISKNVIEGYQEVVDSYKKT